MSNFSEPQSLLKEIAARTSRELTSVEVITYVEALSQSAEKDYTVKPFAVNSTLTVTFIYLLQPSPLLAEVLWHLNLDQVAKVCLKCFQSWNRRNLLRCSISWTETRGRGQ